MKMHSPEVRSKGAKEKQQRRGGGGGSRRRSLLSRCCASFSSFNFFFHCFLFKLSNALDLQRLVASVDANGGATRVE